MSRRRTLLLTTAAMIAVAGFAPLCPAQSSSLYLAPQEPVQPHEPVQGMIDRRPAQLTGLNFQSVRLPEPRRFALHDLVTIIIRESVEADSTSELETEKDSQFGGDIEAFPNLDMRQLLNFQLNPSAMEQGAPRLDMGFDKQFEGEGDYRRSDTFVTRITARIIDIKPNGLLVLEARKYMKTDDETSELVLTGTCRKEDISADNTVLSTELYDLRLNTRHEGELRNASKKGVITKFFDLLFDF